MVLFFFLAKIGIISFRNDGKSILKSELAQNT